MQTGKILFIHSHNNKIELIYSKDSNISYPTHTHESNYTLGFVLKGTIEIEQNMKRQKCCEGDYFLITPNTAHSVHPYNGKYSTLSVCLQRNFLNQYNTEEIFLTLQKLTNILVKDGIVLIQQLLMLRNAIEILYMNLDETVVLKNDAINKVKELLADATENQISIKQLSEKVFLSQYYLIRVFKKQNGLTPHQFQMQNRIRKAKQLLLKGDTITEVALATGFYDQSHFDKLFRKIVGIAPSEYVQVQVLLPEP